MFETRQFCDPRKIPIFVGHRKSISNRTNCNLTINAESNQNPSGFTEPIQADCAAS